MRERTGCMASLLTLHTAHTVQPSAGRASQQAPACRTYDRRAVLHLDEAC